MDFTVTDVPFACCRKHARGYSLTVKERHFHGLILIINGEFEMAVNGQLFRATPGSILMPRKGDAYKISAKQECGVEYVVISYSLESDDLDLAPYHDRIFSCEHPGRYHSLFEKVARVYESNNVCAKPWLRALVQEIICNIFRDSYPSPAFSEQNPVDKAKKYIECNYHLDLSAEAISEAAGLSPSYLRACFKKSGKESPIHYLNRIRIEHAKEMLDAEAFSLSEISEACGFKNVYYFNRVFKNFTGISPGRY